MACFLALQPATNRRAEYLPGIFAYHLQVSIDENTVGRNDS
jgi:hypothetical protein